MKFLSTIVVAALIATGALTIGYVNEGQAQDAGAIVKDRVAAMKGIGAINARLAKAEDTKAISVDAKEMAATAAKIPSWFPANSITPDSRAKPEIWQNMADFTAKANGLQSAANELVAIADKGDLAAAQQQVKAVASTCGACHTPYRGPAKQ